MGFTRDFLNALSADGIIIIGGGSRAQGKERELELDAERIKYWISKGAQPTQTITDLLKKQQIL